MILTESSDGHPRRDVAVSTAPLLAISCALAIVACGSAPSTIDKRSPAFDEGSIVIESVTIISPERDGALITADVLIRDGRIAAIGTDVRVGKGAQRIDGTGRYLVPGLIDSHVHVGHTMALDDAVIERRPDLVDAYRAQVPRAYLAFGFTTLVDLDLRPENKKTFGATPVHPRLYHCGRGVRTAGGYGAMRLPSDARTDNFGHLVHEVDQSAQWPRTLEPNDHTPEQVVQRVAEAGGKCVKAFSESGFSLFAWPVPRPETLDSLRAEAARRGMTFVMHATGLDGWRAALDAHADVIAHGLWHWPGDRADTRPPDVVRAIIGEAARGGVRVQPTLRVLQAERAIFDWALLDDPRLLWALPPEIIAYLRTDEAQRARHALAEEYEEAARGAGAKSGAAALIAAYNVRATATMRLMAESGVTLILGSDTPSGEGIGNPPGLNGRLELQHWAEAGIPPLRILRAATLDNAIAFGLDAELGSIEVGKRADLLLLAANPLESVAAYDSLELVILNGKAITRDSLRSGNAGETQRGEGTAH
jgi:imidazolonepropionase-like amidohydrolase